MFCYLGLFYVLDTMIAFDLRFWWVDLYCWVLVWNKIVITGWRT